MSDPSVPSDGPLEGSGATTAVDGTPLGVDISHDQQARLIWVVFLAGPVIWFVHFMVVYLIVDAGCTGDGPGVRLFHPPVPKIATLMATAAAAIACLGFSAWAHRRWRKGTPEPAVGEAVLAGGTNDGDVERRLAFGGLLLSLLFFVAVLFVGLPALVLPAC